MTQESPRIQCMKWLKSKTVFNPFSLEQTCLGFLKQLIQSYPELNKQEKEKMQFALHGLLSLPSKYTSEITQQVLRTTWSRAAMMNNHYQTVDQFLVGELQSRLTKNLDFDRLAPNYRIQAILNLHRMPNLLKLNLRLAGPKCWSQTFTAGETDRIFSQLTSLRELTFQNLADDNFMAYIGKYCKKLCSLDLQGSTNVSNESLAVISKLPDLVALDLSGTSIDETMLLVLVNNEQRFVDLGGIADIGLLGPESRLPLKHLHLKNPTQADTDLIAKDCANLENLELRLVSRGCKLHKLGTLQHLHNIHVSGPNYRSCNLGVFLLGRAPVLSRLYLEHVSGMDSCDLRSIGQYLVSLEELTLMNCCLSRGLMDRVEERTAERKQIRLFTSLKKLNISSNISPSQFLMLSGHAVQLERLQTGLSCWVSTRLLSHLVRLNKLEKLTYLRIDYTSDLCAAALFLLLRTAKLLTTIVGAETWQDLDQRSCVELNCLFSDYQLPHHLVSFQSQIF